MKKSVTNILVQGLLYAILALFLAGSIINCGGGGGSSSSPAQIQPPKTLIQDFIAKHKTMVDTTLVDLYVKDEQPIVAAAVQKAIDEKKAAGELQGLQQAKFDFSNLKIEVVGQKEDYINDRPRKLMKVNVSGSYVMQNDNGAETIPADESIVLEMVNDNWRVTEKVDPWKEYHYKSHG